MAKQQCTCTICGSQFDFKAHKANLYCGMSCYRAAQRRGDYKRGSKLVGKCTHCGDTVRGKGKSTCRDGRQAEHLFCDRACYDAFRAGIVKAERESECIECGVTYLKHHNGSGRFCSMACRTAHKKAKPRHCVNCQCWFTPMKPIYRRGGTDFVSVNNAKTCSKTCEMEWRSNNEDRKEKISKAFTGSKHPNWQGGPQLQHRGARGAGWQRARRAALKRDKHTCQDCGMTEAEHVELTGKGLEVHHKRPFWQFNGDNAKANALGNLLSLCKSCHQKADWAYRKANPVQMGLTIT